MRGLWFTTVVTAALACACHGPRDGTTRATARPLKGDSPEVMGVQKFVPADGKIGEEFGNAAAVSGDTALVAAHQDHAQGTSTGAVYILARTSGGAWKQQQKLNASDGASLSRFGNELDLDASTAIVGVREALTYTGAAYVFARTGTVWKQQQKLTAADGKKQHYFGVDVAVSGDHALVGAKGDGDRAGNAGAVYLFKRMGSVWAQYQKITASDGAHWDAFGATLDMDGATFIAGVGNRTSLGPASHGLVYVFARSGITWKQQARITAPAGGPLNPNGVSLSLNKDTLLFGAAQEGAGAAYIFSRAGTSWSQKARLTALDVVKGDNLGHRVALYDGVAAVSTIGGMNFKKKKGATYLFYRDGTGWSLQLKLTAKDGAAGDRFGSALALGKNTALVGAHGDDDKGDWSGSAYFFKLCGETVLGPLKHQKTFKGTAWGLGAEVAINGPLAMAGDPLWNQKRGRVKVYEASAGKWSEVGTIAVKAGDKDDWFGSALALSPPLAVIGAPQEWTKTKQEGAVYLFARSGTTWSKQQKLTAADGKKGDVLGVSVAIQGDTLLAGAPGASPGYWKAAGAVYAFTRSGAVWSPQGKFHAADRQTQSGFGSAILFKDDMAVVSAPSFDVVAQNNDGIVYVFSRNGSTWTEQQKLTASDINTVSGFGRALGLSGRTMVIGAPVGDLTWNGYYQAGAAYVFSRTGTTWKEQQRLTASDRWAYDSFGSAVAIRGSSILIAADRDDDGATDTGSLYQFQRTGTVWQQVAKMTAPDAELGGYFGSALALHDGTVMVGSLGWTKPYNAPGKAYFYQAPVSCMKETPDATPPDATPSDSGTLDIALDPSDAARPDLGLESPATPPEGCSCDTGQAPGSTPLLSLLLLALIRRGRAPP